MSSFLRLLLPQLDHGLIRAHQFGTFMWRTQQGISDALQVPASS